MPKNIKQFGTLSECIAVFLTKYRKIDGMENLLNSNQGNLGTSCSPYLHIFLLPVVLFIRLDSFGVSCLVLKISAVEISAFS